MRYHLPALLLSTSLALAGQHCQTSAACHPDSLRADACPSSSAGCGGCPSLAQQPGPWGLEFGIGSNFTLRSASGSTLSVVRRLGDQRRLRIGISMGLYKDDTDHSSSSHVQDSVIEELETGSREETQISVVAQHVWMAEPGKVRWLAGVGPMLSYQTNSRESRDDEELDTIDDASYGIGVQGFAGVEWAFHRNFSLQAQYSSSLQYIDRHVEQVSRLRENTSLYTKSEMDYSIWSLNSQSVLFSLVAWF